MEQETLHDQPAPTPAEILVVDDEETVCEAVHRILVKTGYQVHVCKNGKAAISFYNKNWQKIKLIILDMVMPEMSGKETFLALKKINPELKVLLSSGYSLNGEAQEILDVGAKDFIHKPFKLRVLREKVHELLQE